MASSPPGFWFHDAGRLKIEPLMEAIWGQKFVDMYEDERPALIIHPSPIRTEGKIFGFNVKTNEEFEWRAERLRRKG